MELKDTWEVRSIVERIKSESGAKITAYLAKPPYLGIIATDPIFGKEPASSFGGYLWKYVIELSPGESASERLSKELMSC
jgi:hypothetical protein